MKSERATAVSFREERSKEISGLCMELSRKSMEMVEQRYQSLQSSASHLMTCISLVSVALATLLPVLFSYCPDGALWIGVVYFFAFALLLAALTLTLVARYRFQYMIMRSPGWMVDYIVKSSQEFNDICEIGQFYGRCLEEHYNSMQERNDKMSLCVKFAFGLICFCLVAVFIALLLISIYQVALH